MVTSTHIHSELSQLLTDTEELRAHVDLSVNSAEVVDMHTHLFPPEFKELCLFGIDELLTYHYLVAETFRSIDLTYDQFWLMSKTEQADLVWKTLFVENSPTSEAARGVISVLDEFGLDTRAKDLKQAREFFNSRHLADHIDQTFRSARIKNVVMTNDPLDDSEKEVWRNGSARDPRFKPALRLDGLVNDWGEAAAITLARHGVSVRPDLDHATITNVRLFLDKWITRIDPVYLGLSLPSDFTFPGKDARGRLLREVVLPTAKEHGLALTLMIGVRRGVNPELRCAGDGLGKADVTALEGLCAAYPDVKFLATFLSRENQHELCVAARKFPNLMPFGCWWFLNNPSIVSEITRERFELLGQSFIPQHSDARVLEHLIYKWKHAKKEIADALYTSYEQLLNSGRAVTAEEIVRDVNRMFSGNFETFTTSRRERSA